MAENILSSAANTITDYLSRVGKFRPNARLYLVNVILSGLSMGVFRLLFNFYALSLGFDEALLGRLVTTSSLTALIVALPAGYLADILGRKRSLVIGGALISVAIFGMVLFPTERAFYILNIIIGFAQSLWSITMAPFLMENSGEEERTYLFSFGQGLQMLSSFAGNWLGGYLPSWMGAWQNVESTHSTAYAWSVVVVRCHWRQDIYRTFTLLYAHKGACASVMKFRLVLVDWENISGDLRPRELYQT